MSSVENSVFFALIYKLENQKDTAIELSLTELKSLIGKSQEKTAYIQKAIENMAEKFSRFSVKDEKETYTNFFSVFEVLTVPKQEPCIKAKLSNQFIHLLNDVSSEFTLFDLSMYSSFSSKYSQTAYRLVKQWHSTGYHKLTIEKFREALNIPKCYNQDTIDKRVIKQIENDFIARNLYTYNTFDKNGKPIKKTITIQKIKAKTRGEKVTHIEFIFNKNEKSKFDELQQLENTTPKDTRYAESMANRQQILDNQKAKQQIKQHNVAALAAGCNALKVDEPIDEREARIKKEVQRTNMSTIMKKYALRTFSYKSNYYKIWNFEYNADGELVLFVKDEDDKIVRYNHTFKSCEHFDNYVKDYLT